MLAIEPRFLVLTAWNGETHAAVEYGDHKRTRASVARGEAQRIEISPVQAMMGPIKLKALLEAGKL